MRRGWLFVVVLACTASAWAQDSKALQALLALPGFDIPFAFQASEVGGLLVADRRETLVAKGATRTAMETVDLVAMETDKARKKAIAEEALARADNDADRVLLWTTAGRIAEAEPLVSSLGTGALSALRAQVEFHAARIDAILEGALGPLAADLRTQPSAIIAARPLLGPDTQVLLRLLEGSRDELQTVGAVLDASRKEHGRDVAWYRVWLACRQTRVYHVLLQGLLNAPQSNPAGRAKTELATLSRDAVAFARDTGDGEAFCSLVMHGLGSDSTAQQLEEQLKTMTTVLGDAPPRQRLAAWLIEGAIRYAVLHDEPGARRALRSAWEASAARPEVRASIAGPLALLTLAWGSSEEAAAFGREARSALGAVLASQIEIQALYNKGDLAGAAKAIEALDDPALGPWKAVAGSVVAAKRAKDKAEWKRLSNAFTVQFAQVYRGEDLRLKGDALFHSAVLAALGGELERARSANLLLLELEPGSERLAALRKALGGGV